MIDFKGELEVLKKQSEELDHAFLNRKEEIEEAQGVMNTLLTKLNQKQSAVEMQVEEMFCILEEQQEEQKGCVEKDDARKREVDQFVHTLIVAADLIEDFFLYAEQDANTQLADQVGLMWRRFSKELGNVGLTRIADEHTPFDERLNHVEGVTDQGDDPQGYISSVLRSGYLFGNQVYRKSSVIVKKLEEDTNEQNYRN